MKNITRPVAILIVLGLVAIPAINSFAASLIPYYLSLSASSTSINADGSKITLTAYAYYFKCADLSVKLQGELCSDGSTPAQYPMTGKKLIVTASGMTVDGNTTTGSDGKAQFTVSSTSTGTKQLSTTLEYGTPENGVQTVSLTFKSVVAAPTPRASTPTPRVSAPTPAPAPAPEPPKTPEVGSFQIAGQTATDTNNITLENDQPFELKGKTVAGGTVKLYIFSTPREASVTADAEGNWTYTIEGLEPGSHHVEAEVTDPATQKTSARGTLVAFTVNEPEKTANTNSEAPKEDSKSWLLWAIGGGAALLAAAGGGTWWLLKKRKRTLTNRTPNADTSTPPETTPATPGESLQQDDTQNSQTNKQE